MQSAVREGQLHRLARPRTESISETHLLEKHGGRLEAVLSSRFTLLCTNPSMVQSFTFLEQGALNFWIWWWSSWRRFKLKWWHLLALSRDAT